MRCLSLLFFYCLCFPIALLGQGEHAFSVKIEDGGSFKVQAVKDSNGLMDHYQADIKAPVCEDRVCYDVSVRFQWNLIGQFVSYKVAEHDPLTKMDHDPFLPEDYQKLQSILTSQDLSFVRIPKEELVIESDSMGVDGYTGATKATVKKEVIEGALYTCYTLWHIANGAAVDSMKAYTQKLLQRPLIEKMLRQENQTMHYYLLNTLTSSQYESHIDDILELVANAKGYFSKNALEKIPVDLYEKEAVSSFILSHYKALDYYAQLAILKKLDEVDLSVAIRDFMTLQIDPKNTFQNQKLLAMVLKGIDQDTFTALIAYLKEQDIAVSDQNYRVIEMQNSKFGQNLSSIKRN